jgi:hypothetical protein
MNLGHRHRPGLLELTPVMPRFLAMISLLRFAIRWFAIHAPSLQPALCTALLVPQKTCPSITIVREYCARNVAKIRFAQSLLFCARLSREQFELALDQSEK